MKQLFLFLLLTCSFMAQAKDIEFVVYFTKGKISKSGNDKSPVIKKGDHLYAQDVLLLAEGAQVVLICKNYNTVQLKTKGRYAIKTLLAQCRRAQASFTGSYFHYIWDELTHVHGSPEKEPKNYMRNTGAVSRGCVMVKTRLALDTLHYYSGSLPLYWSASFPAPSLRIYDDPYEGMQLWKGALGNTPIHMEQIAAELKAAGTYYWQVTDAQGAGCERNYLRIWKEEEYKKAVDQLLEPVIATDPAQTAYMKGYLLEEHHFLAEAYKYYQLAAQLNPQHTIYKKAVSRFL